MASNYPSGLDVFNTGHQDSVGEIVHAADVNSLADAVNKIEAELGTLPKGTFSSVSAKLGALFYGQVTTTQRDAILQGSRPTGLIVFNTTTNRYEFNAGTQTTPSWQPVGPAGPWGTSDISDSAITSAKIADGTIVDADVNAAANIGRAKLNFGSGLVNSDIAANAAILSTKISGSLALLDDWTASGSTYYDTNTRFGGNIPQTYRDLVLEINGKGTDASPQPMYLQMNGITTTTYQWVQQRADGNSVTTGGGAASTDRISVGEFERLGGAPSFLSLTFPNYSSTTGFGGIVRSEWGRAQNFGSANLIFVGANYGYQSSNPTVTRIVLFPAAGFPLAGSRFTLYGRG